MKLKHKQKILTMDPRSTTLYFISIIYFKSSSSFSSFSSVYFLYFSSLFFFCTLYFALVLEFWNIINHIWKVWKWNFIWCLWDETKISLKISTLSQLVVVSSIHKYANSIEWCCKYIVNHLLDHKNGWLGPNL